MKIPLFKADSGERVEAVQWTGDFDNLSAFINYMCSLNGDKLLIHIRGELIEASPMDWIIKGVKGEYYTRKPYIFEQTYHPVKPL